MTDQAKTLRAQDAVRPRPELDPELQLVGAALALLDRSEEPPGEPFTAAEIEPFEALAAEQHHAARIVVSRGGRAFFLILPAAQFFPYVARHREGILLATSVGQAEPFIGLFPDLDTVREQLAAGLFDIAAALVEADQRESSQALN